MSYPKSEGTVRPFRLWNAKEKKPLRWRCYSDRKRAHMGALIEARWSKVGTAVSPKYFSPTGGWT